MMGYRGEKKREREKRERKKKEQSNSLINFPLSPFV
jgi:hypothetical protein